ncbi:MAG: HDOD domain-containing protein [Myxococcales bacterium]|nr:HDOD domain-containing protein [Myxococcales bacterium]
MTPRILFVDDDADVLRGLTKALRKQRERWDMVFAVGGPAALEEVRRATFDVVVTDMRMPEIDGAALLLEVRDHAPTTFRMILSGFSDQRSVTRALPVAHQFLDKPCELKMLIEVVDRACALRALFVSDPLRAVFERVARYASPAVLEGEGGPERTARIVRLATSVFLGTEQSMRSSPDPSSPIGRELRAALALASAAHRAIGQPIAGLSFEELQRHSREIAERAQRSVEDPTTAAEAFTAGLVHDLGKAVIAVALPEEHAAIVQGLAQAGARRSEVERAVLGTSHAEIGAYLLVLWGLPLSVIEAVALHGSAIRPTNAVSMALDAAHAR